MRQSTDTGAENAPVKKLPPRRFAAALAAAAAKAPAALRANAPQALLWALYAVLLFFMFQNALGAARPAAALSLRYPGGLSTAGVAQAVLNQRQADTELTLSATFWGQSDDVHFTTGRGQADAAVLLVDGEAPAALRRTFLYGSYPGVLEKRGIAVSESLAWTLFGAIDAVGQELLHGGVTYTVRGVFSGDDPLLLLQADAAGDAAANNAPAANAAQGITASYTGVELSGTFEGDPQQAAAAWAANAGFAEPNAVVNNGTLPGIIAALAWLPAAVVLIWLFFRLLGLLRRAPYWARQAVWFALLLAAAALLPKALEALPGWMVPTRWSDFDHWREFLRGASLRFTEWLSLTPYLGDVEIRRRLIFQAVLLLPALCCAVWLAARRSSSLSEAAAQGESPALPVAPPAEAEDDIALLQSGASYTGRASPGGPKSGEQVK